MARLVFREGEQGEFLRQVRFRLGYSSNGQLAVLVGISGRSFRDWVSGKTLGPEAGLKKLSRLSGVRLPVIIDKKDEHWSAREFARQGALSRLKLYGPPGTSEGRRKGGLISQQKRQLYPEMYKDSDWVRRKNFVQPSLSSDLAEIIGIILGDGGLTIGQLKITLNSVVDKDYSLYVKGQLEKVFGHKVSIYKRKTEKAVTLSVTGVALVEYLTSIGLRTGNKVKLQVGVPQWVRDNVEFSRMCLRGLMDTDGGIFVHKYWVNGKQYFYLKVCFSNKSQPLREFVFSTLTSHGFTPKYAGDNHVWLYSDTETRRYVEMIGSSNARLLLKLG